MNAFNNGQRRKTAVLYTRVSTDEQAEKGYSLQAQEKRLRDYCVLNGYSIKAHFQDEVSAKTFDRPEFQKLLQLVRQRNSGIDILLCVKWDRFSRNQLAALNMIAELESHGVETQAIDQPLDRRIPEQKVLMSLYLTIPEVENDRRALNTLAGMRRAMREGRWVSRVPIGYKRSRDAQDKAIIVPSDEAHFVRTAFDRMGSGLYSREEVRRFLAESGFKISKNQFGLLLANPIYAGKIRVKAWKDEPEELVPGIHEALIDENLFARVQTVLNNRRGLRHAVKTKQHPELALRGHLKCRKCQRNITGSKSRGNGGVYYYYHCQNGCDERFPAEPANRHFSDYLNQISIPKEIGTLYLSVLEDTFRKNEMDTISKANHIEKEIRDLEARQLRADEKFVTDELQRDAYLRLKKNYDARLEVLRRRLAGLVNVNDGFRESLSFGVSLISDLGGSYLKAPYEIKRSLIGWMFPQKLVYEEGNYRTDAPNEVIQALNGFRADFEQKKRTKRGSISSSSSMVALPGFEPGTS